MNLMWKIRSIVQHYDEDKYWNMRDWVQNTPINSRYKKIKQIWYIFNIKRMDAFANASTGVQFGGNSAIFETRPRLPHGLYGIIIAPGTHIGKNVRICHQVTIGNDFKDIKHVPTIGDNVAIYPGAKIVGKVYIGDGAIIGANAVVISDIPENALVVCEKPRVIIKNMEENL